MGRTAVLIAALLAGCAPGRESGPWVDGPPDPAGETHLVAFPYPPEIFVHTVGEYDRRRIVIPGIECPDPDRAVRPLWGYASGEVIIKPDGSVRLKRGKYETDAADLLVKRGGCRRL